MSYNILQFSIPHVISLNVLSTMTNNIGIYALAQRWIVRFPVVAIDAAAFASKNLYNAREGFLERG